MCNGWRDFALHITQSTLHSRSGQAIFEYLVITAIVLAAITGIAQLVGNKASQVMTNAVNSVP